MSNGTDESATDGQSKSSYDDLINEGIDELNESQTFGETKLKKEEKALSESSGLLQTWWYKAMLCVAILSLGLSLYYRSNPVGLYFDEQAAEEDLKAFFGDAYQELADAINGTDEE